MIDNIISLIGLVVLAVCAVFIVKEVGFIIWYRRAMKKCRKAEMEQKLKQFKALIDDRRSYDNPSIDQDLT